MDLLVGLLICFDVLFLEAIGAAAVNLALHKPSIQGTMFNGQSSDLAVDGNHDPAGGCAHTSTGGKNWWIVDLQNIYNIDVVHATNRDTQMARLNNLHVEGFPVGDPYLCPSPINTCGFNAVAGAVVTLNCPNNTIARYIRLRGVLSMTVCEVDVFGQEVSDCKKWNMELQNGKRLQSSFLNLGSATSPVDCFTLCQRHFTLCNVYNYNVMDGTCLVPSKPLKDEDLTNDGDWRLYYTC